MQLTLRSLTPAQPRVLDAKYPCLLLFSCVLPPTPRVRVQLVAEALGWSQFGGIILIFFGERIFNLMGIPQPDWNVWMRENKLMSGLGIMFGEAPAPFQAPPPPPFWRCNTLCAHG